MEQLPTRTLATLYALAGLAILALLTIAYGTVARHWLAVHVGIGTTPRAVYWYSFWSGIGSDLGEAAILGGLVHTARRINCQVKGCWRFTHYEYDLDGVTHKVCRHHHPQLGKTHRLSHAHLLSHHEAKTAAQGSAQ